MRSTISIYCMLAFLLAMPLYGQSLEEDPNLISGRLSNGLQYYVYPTKKVKGQAAFQLFLKAGSLQEQENQRGLAHFMEHMAFNGSRNFPGNSLTAFLEQIGMKFGHDLNAHTSYGETIYKLKVPTENPKIVDSTLLILQDWVHGITMDSLEIEKERGVVLSEWLSKQTAKENTQMAFLELLLNNSRYSERKVIGDTATLKNFKREELLDYYKSWYDPSLMAIAIAGDIDAHQIEQKIITRFSDIQSNQPEKKHYPIEGFKKSELKVVTDSGSDKIELTAVQLLEPYRDIQTKNDFEVYLKKNLLNKLFKERFRNKSFESTKYKSAGISIGNYFPVKAALMHTVELKKDSTAQGIRDYWYDALQLFTYGFTNLEIEKVKKETLQQLAKSARSENAPSPGIMIKEAYQKFFYGNAIVTAKKEYQLTKETLQKIDSIVLLRELKRLFEPKRTKHLLTANVEDKESLPGNRRFKRLLTFKKRAIKPYTKELQVPEQLLHELPDPGAIISKKQLQEIDATEYLLSNGIKLIYKQSDSDRNSVILSGFREGGFYALPKEDYVTGLYAVPVVSLSGYGGFEREALSQYLAGNSAKATLLADKTRTGFHASADIKDKSTMFQLLYLKWTQPNVDNKIFNEVKDATIQSKINDKSTPAKILKRKISNQLRKEDYVTARLNVDDIRSKLEKNKILNTYNRFFGNANDYIITLISYKPFEYYEQDILQYIASLPSGNTNTHYTYEPVYHLNDRVSISENDTDAQKATVSLVFQQNKPVESLAKTDLQNLVIKDLIRNRLLTQLREEMGEVYSVSVSANTITQPKPLSRQSISFTCDPAKVELLIDETNKTLSKMARGIIEPEELLNIKTNLHKVNGLLKQKNTYWTKAIREHYFNKYNNWDAIVEYQKWINDINIKEISKLIEEYFIESPMVQAVLLPNQKEVNNLGVSTQNMNPKN